MTNIVIPLAGDSKFFSEDLIFPKILTEIRGKTMLEHFIANISCIKNSRLIFIIKKQDQKYYLEESIKLLNKESIVISLQKQTKGMACSSMFAIDYINNDDELIICNGDQIFELDLSEVVKHFRAYDGGVISFESFHPRFAFVLSDEKDEVIEASEKKPISKNAIAGFYYFKRGKDFIRSCEKMIEKDAQIDGSFFIAPCLNELILENKIIKNFSIEKSKYHTFYSPAKIEQYERIKND